VECVLFLGRFKKIFNKLRKKGICLLFCAKKNTVRYDINLIKMWLIVLVPYNIATYFTYKRIDLCPSNRAKEFTWLKFGAFAFEVPGSPIWHPHHTHIQQYTIHTHNTHTHTTHTQYTQYTHIACTYIHPYNAHHTHNTQHTHKTHTHTHTHTHTQHNLNRNHVPQSE